MQITYASFRPLFEHQTDICLLCGFSFGSLLGISVAFWMGGSCLGRVIHGVAEFVVYQLPSSFLSTGGTITYFSLVETSISPVLASIFAF